jgi:GT2 family glycosyltransferase
MAFSVLIPSKNADNVDRCVGSIRDQGETCRVIVIDDGLERKREDCDYIEGVKPFIYARAINQGIKAAGSDDVILLNDDTELLKVEGFTKLAREFGEHEGLGLLSAGIQGTVCNPIQVPRADPCFRQEQAMLAFVAVYISRAAIEKVGLLDERYDGYGCDDNDFCRRALMAGIRLGVWDGCVVDHSDPTRSSFRNGPNWERIYRHNLHLYQEKWKMRKFGSAAEESFRCVDLLFLAKNRRAFTMEAFDALDANTDWFLVKKLFVYDDGSTDGTREWLKDAIPRIDAEVVFLETNYGDPVGVMADWIERSESPFLAKVDNDAVMPPGWLNTAMEVMRVHPELDMLGLEAMKPHSLDDELKRGYEKTQQIGGLGLFRRRCFQMDDLPKMGTPFGGFWEWQENGGKALIKGWMKPSVPVFLLDRLPIEPWKSLCKEYEANNWQRPWWNYSQETAPLWEWRYGKA